MDIFIQHACFMQYDGQSTSMWLREFEQRRDLLTLSQRMPVGLSTAMLCLLVRGCTASAATSITATITCALCSRARMRARATLPAI